MPTDYEKLLQRVHATAGDVTQIFLGEMEPHQIAAIEESLLTLLGNLKSKGTTSELDLMIVIGALSGIGHDV
jgi:hypothetical protein